MITISYIHKIDKETTSKLTDSPITEEMANYITKYITKKLDIPEISVYFVNKLVYDDTIMEQFCFLFGIDYFYHLFMELKLKCNMYVKLIGGETLLNQQTIVLYNTGQSVVSLLHEIAHLIPGSCGHEISWEENYRKVIECYQELIAPENNILQNKGEN